MGNCPSKQILSVYFDGELPHPFDGKVREHIDVCSSCKNEIAGFVKLSENMLKPENVIYNTAKTRIWSKLSVRSMPVQKRHYISIPVGIAAAVVIAVSSILVYEFLRNNGSDKYLASYELDDSFQNSSQNVNELVQFLEDEEDSNFVIIHLPKSRNFNRFGEPKLMTAQDYPKKGTIR